MHALKVVALLIVTLGIMRTISWLAGWLLHRARGRTTSVSAPLANLLALGAFAAWLFWNLSPGEPFDYAPVIFGAAVYASYSLMDLKWLPWQAGGASRPAR
jgi:hypothetical protein